MKILYKQCQFSDGLNYSIHPFYIIWLLKIIITLTSTILFDSFVGCIVRYVYVFIKSDFGNPNSLQKYQLEGSIMLFVTAA